MIFQTAVQGSEDAVMSPGSEQGRLVSSKYLSDACIVYSIS